ncbi:MAG: hypothetical protein HYR72_05870 [Deltaproteobacteria bacterium]|nr:hypothetical protein [Deltaproteobacteria bacterium]MBI3387724.1 hypothetical protein [Deltaproteobacteria bacterium]
MLSALLATVLVFAGVGVLLYLVAVLYNAVRASLATSARASSRAPTRLPVNGGVIANLERWRINRYVERARRGDVLRERGDLDGALREFQAAFFLSPIRSRSLASMVVNHHTGLLSRLLAVTEDVQGGTVRLFSLAKVDRLLNERSDLQRRYFVSRNAGDRRHRELAQQLTQNRRELHAALRQLIVEIQSSRQPTRMQ